MKPSKRNALNAKLKAEKYSGKRPTQTKYSAKVAAEVARLAKAKPQG